MKIPKVKNETISSIRAQMGRSNNPEWGNTYLMSLVEDIKEENVEIYKSIYGTADNSTDAIIEKFEENLRDGVSKDLGMDIEIDDDVMSRIALQNVRSDIFNSMFAMAVTIYQSIKQQMVVDELEE